MEPAVMFPFFIGYRLPVPDEFVEVETQRAAMLRVLTDECKVLRTIPDDERESACLSLALTLTRAEYHEKRFARVITTLEQRRIVLQAAYTSDLIAKYAVYEAAAFLGAARLALDELAHIIARRHGVASSRTLKTVWATNELFTADLSKIVVLDVPEVHALRAHLDCMRDRLAGFLQCSHTVADAC